MTFSIIICVLLVVSLAVYFIFSRRLRTPTVTTEILIKKYNARLNKLARFLSKNKIEFSLQQFFSSIEKSELDWNKMSANVKTIKNIEQNNELIEEILIESSKNAAIAKLNELKKGCTLFEFAGELSVDAAASQVFDILGKEKSKLDFEMQRYFGSQDFYKFENKLVFVQDNLALKVDPKNIFACEIVKFEIKTTLKSKKSGENAPIYTIFLTLGAKNELIDLSVPQENVQKILKRFQQKNSD